MKPRQQTRSYCANSRSECLKIRRDLVMAITPLLIFEKRVFYYTEKEGIINDSNISKNSIQS